MNPSSQPAGGSTGGFGPTRWTLVRRAGVDSAEGRAALSDLCEAYWAPVFRFLCRDGRDEDTARELAQEFFARLLERGGLQGADPARGRFRTFLLGAVKHFLAARRARDRAWKRGGGVETLPLEESGQEWEAGEPCTMPEDDAFFDREWALRVMDRGLRALESEWTCEGRAAQFTVLKPWLVGAAAAPAHAEAARALGTSEGAVKVAVHRLRRRFGDLIRAEIRATVEDGEPVEAELAYLIEVLSR